LIPAGVDVPVPALCPATTSVPNEENNQLGS
jgi:hypothetical protein